ncbi:MAG: esterase-like activity of phytase family protein [Hyphomonadaceae bacterium]|nr:esterase-like activity of phytase family protein [Hyphomonadaceae bacterium]
MSLPRLAAALTALAILTGCASPPAPLPDASAAFTLSQASAALHTASCPEGIAYQRASSLEITATQIELGGALPLGPTQPDVSFAGGWHLTSPDSNFGGLSGLDIFASGNLLTVTDEGAFVWINMEDGAPASAHIAYMRGADGQFLSGKSMKDSEGLVLTEDGLALVSYERNHRVDAFDLEGCGAAARSVSLADLNSPPEGMSKGLEENGGAEGLALMGETLLLGIETPDAGGPLAKLSSDSKATLIARLPLEGGLKITGLDVLDETLYGVARDYNPLFGNTIDVFSIDMSGETPAAPVRLFRLDPSVSVDNFEGIAAVRKDDATVRVWIISDNNFSDRQRTLLMAFDVK